MVLQRVVASCHTPVAENQHIFTSNEALTSLRKNIVELVLTDHPMECDTCEVNNNCELQTVANDLGVLITDITVQNNIKVFQEIHLMIT